MPLSSAEKSRRYQARLRGEKVPFLPFNKPVPIEKRFWKRVEKTDSCWIWKGGHFNAGYGGIRYNGKSQYAHIVAFILSGGKLVKSKELHHTCENKGCVNPFHLRLLSRSQHASHHTIGELNHASKLSDVKVLFIRSSKEKGKALARQFNVTEALISAVKKRKIWKHL